MSAALLECNSKVCKGRIQDHIEVPAKVRGHTAYRCEVCSAVRLLGGITTVVAEEKKWKCKVPTTLSLPDWKDKRKVAKAMKKAGYNTKRIPMIVR